MTEEKKSKTVLDAREETHSATQSPGNGHDAPSPESGQHDEPHAVSAQALRDEEIEEIQKRSRHQPPTIQAPPELPPAPPRKALVIVGILLLVLILAGAATMFERMTQERVLAKETEAESIPTVAFVYPQKEKADEELVLPGSLLAYVESPIYARTNGYLVRWYKDIGSHVNKGELLAKIDTPEVDQELNQARATRQQTQAALELAKISADRWEKLLKTDSVSAQEADQQESGYKQAQANLAAADANVKRLEQLEGFKQVYAPFTGVLTRRLVDPGALINAGDGGAGRQLFNMARVDPLRVFTSVPQAYAPFIKVGAKTFITLQEMPGQKFVASIARTAEAIDTNTRTLLTEVDVPNPDDRLLPGSFGEVHFKVGNNVDKVTVPVNAMLFRSQGAQVAVIGQNNKIELRQINIGRDFGTALEILGGVSATDRIVVNPPDSLEDGQQVNIAQAAPRPAQPADVTPGSGPEQQTNQQKGND
ncbi:MAG TPA: efflux RND transporter periplasmic adaptor subunit [Candidatus Aquilonibacter sp.]|nr:efflux RND transporter periplasmic adaptor subunit [Candidatus Aquilonibacter sp.]